MNKETHKEAVTLRDDLAVERNVLAVERNELAVERNELANERTVLSYARTSIMGFITGVTLVKLFPGNMVIAVLAWFSIAVSALVVVVGLVRFIYRFKSLSKAASKRTSRSRGD